MSAQVYGPAAWAAARQRLAARAKGATRTIRRGIYLREHSDGRWSAAIFVWRHGKWTRTEVVSEPTTYRAARHAAIAAWQSTRMPFLYLRDGRAGAFGFRPGISEPTIGGAA